MAHFGKKIRELRDERHLSIDELAKRSGISRSTIWNVEQSASFNMQGSTYKLLALAFGMTTAELDRAWRGGPAPRTEGGDGIPVINRAPAGAVVDYHEIGTDSGQGHFYLDRGVIMDPNAYAVIVTGDSMTGQLDDGDYAVFVPVDQDGRMHNGNHNVADGQTVFVRFSQERREGGCTIAMVYRLKDGRIELRKRNPRYPPIIVSPEEIGQVGLLVESRKVWVKGLHLDKPAYENSGGTKAQALRPDAADDRPQEFPDYDHS